MQSFNNYLDKGDVVDTHAICNTCVGHSMPRMSLCSPDIKTKNLGKAWHSSFPVHTSELLFNSKVQFRDRKRDDSHLGFFQSQSTSVCTHLSFIPAKKSGCFWNILSHLNVYEVSLFRHKCVIWGFPKAFCRDLALNNLKRLTCWGVWEKIFQQIKCLKRRIEMNYVYLYVT